MLRLPAIRLVQLTPFGKESSLGRSSRNRSNQVDRVIERKSADGDADPPPLSRSSGQPEFMLLTPARCAAYHEPVMERRYGADFNKEEYQNL